VNFTFRLPQQRFKSNALSHLPSTSCTRITFQFTPEPTLLRVRVDGGGGFRGLSPLATLKPLASLLSAPGGQYTPCSLLQHLIGLKMHQNRGFNANISEIFLRRGTPPARALDPLLFSDNLHTDLTTCRLCTSFSGPPVNRAGWRGPLAIPLSRLNDVV